MVMMPEASAEVFRDVHYLVDDDFLLFFIAEIVESFRDELQDIKSLYPHGDLQDFAHPVAPGNDSSRRRPKASDADDFIQVDVREVQRSNDILEPGLDVVCDFILDAP